MSEEEIDQSLKMYQSVLIQSVIDYFSYDEKSLLIQISKNKKQLSLVFSLKVGNPYFFLADEPIRSIQALKKPLSLFAKTHFQGETIEDLKRDQERGRVLRLSTTDPKKNIIISLIPGSANIEFVVDKKRVSAFKPKDLSAHIKNQTLNEVRPPDFFLKHWLNLENKVSDKTPKTKDFAKALLQKKSGLEKMQEKLKISEDNIWLKAGLWLKENLDYETIPKEFKDIIDPSQSHSRNIKTCFEKAKKNKAKITGTLHRVQQLQAEIEVLENQLAHPEKLSKKTTPAKSTLKSLHKISDSQGRTHEWGAFRLYIGRSGADNLRLLRKAKSWYLWLHIKDYPGAHGILERPRGPLESVELEVIKKAALAVIKQSVTSDKSGVFDVIYAECRYVRPVKGAKAGQVTLSHEKVISVRI